MLPEALALHLPKISREVIFLGSAALFTTLSGIFRPVSVATAVDFRFNRSSDLWEELYASLATTINVFKNRHCSTVLAICRPKPVFSWTFRTSIFSWRECLMTPDDGTLVLDYFQYRGTPKTMWSFLTSLFFTPGSGLGIMRTHKADTKVPVVLVVHGLMGHSEESYVQQTCCEICTQDSRHPIVVAMNYRGAFNHSLNGTGGYSFYDTKDLAFLITWLREKHKGPLFVVGFSMGAAKLANYLGRTEEASNVDGACCICCPWDFTVRNGAVHRPDFIEKVYHFVLAGGLKAWILAHYFELRSNQALMESAPIFKCTASALWWWLFSFNVKEFDENFTIHWVGYKSVEEYYEAASPTRLLNKIKTPLLIINSRNDPLIPSYTNPTDEDVHDNPNLFVIESTYGGHIGFWTPFNGCFATKCFIKFSNLGQISKSTRKGREVRRKESIEIVKKLQSTSSTCLNDYDIIKRIGEDESDGENMAYVLSSSGEEEEDEVEGEREEVLASPKHDELKQNFLEGFA